MNKHRWHSAIYLAVIITIASFVGTVFAANGLTTKQWVEKGDEGIKNIDVISFFPHVHKIIQAPPPLMKTLNQYFTGKIDDGYITLLKTSEQGMVVGTWSKKPLDDVKKYISLDSVDSYGIEWLYLFDRNGDGQFDYVCFPVGPMLIQPTDLPADFPKAQKAAILNKSQMLYFMTHVRMVFSHYADDNFDGQIDAAVIDVADSKHFMTVGQWVFIRSSKYDGVPDTAWFFYDDINYPAGEPEHTGQGFRFVRPIEISEYEFDSKDYAGFSKVLGWFNEAARQNQIGK